MEEKEAEEEEEEEAKGKKICEEDVRLHTTDVALFVQEKKNGSTGEYLVS